MVRRRVWYLSSVPDPVVYSDYSVFRPAPQSPPEDSWDNGGFRLTFRRGIFGPSLSFTGRYPVAGGPTSSVDRMVLVSVAHGRGSCSQRPPVSVSAFRVGETFYSFHSGSGPVTVTVSVPPWRGHGMRSFPKDTSLSVPTRDRSTTLVDLKSRSRRSLNSTLEQGRPQTES